MYMTKTPTPGGKTRKEPVMKTLFTPNAKQPRKHLAQVIGTILGGTKPTYLGAPSMAYQIGPVTLTRDWTVAWPAGLPARDVDLIEAVAAQGRLRTHPNRPTRKHPRGRRLGGPQRILWGSRSGRCGVDAGVPDHRVG